MISLLFALLYCLLYVGPSPSMAVTLPGFHICVSLHQLPSGPQTTNITEAWFHPIQMKRIPQIVEVRFQSVIITIVVSLYLDPVTPLLIYIHITNRNSLLSHFSFWSRSQTPLSFWDLYATRRASCPRDIQRILKSRSGAGGHLPSEPELTPRTSQLCNWIINKSQ